jgi:hypothetical protein
MYNNNFGKIVKEQSERVFSKIRTLLLILKRDVNLEDNLKN